MNGDVPIRIGDAIEETVRWVLWMVGAMTAALLRVSFYPELALAIPRALGYLNGPGCNARVMAIYNTTALNSPCLLALMIDKAETEAPIGLAAALPPGDLHLLDEQRTDLLGATQQYVVANRRHVPEHVAQIAGDRHLFNGVHDLAVFNPVTGGTA